MIARHPEHVTVPDAVADFAGTRRIRPVWENELGGLTFEVGTGADRCFVKWTPRHSGIDLGREAARLAWARPFTPVPDVLDRGADEAGTWIVCSPIGGDNAVAARWKDDPVTAVTAIGHGLRAWHDALPVEHCPFSWSHEKRVHDARARANAGRIDPSRWHESHWHLTVERALELVSEAPSIDALVVCHGDACAPNTMLDETGHCTGHVDAGEMGVADRWADIAVATWSTQWNYGPGFEETLLASYGIDADPARTRYYRLLWELGP